MQLPLLLRYGFRVNSILISIEKSICFYRTVNVLKMKFSTFLPFWNILYVDSFRNMRLIDQRIGRISNRFNVKSIGGIKFPDT